MRHATFLPGAAPYARHVRAALRRRPPRPRAEPAAPLEPRRLFAAFLATAGDDVIRISGRPGDMHVVINGVDHATADNNVEITAGDGEDTVYLGAIAHGGLTALTLHLGAGNDSVTNFNPDTNTGRLDSLHPGFIDVRGGDGSDSIGFDDSASPATAPGHQYTFGRNVGLPSPSRMTYFDGLLAPTTVAYESVERFDLDCGAGNDTAYLYQKPPGMILSVTGGGGVDSVQAGGGDFDASGWSAGTTTLSGGTGNDTAAFFDQFDTSTPPGSVTIAGPNVTRGSTGFTYFGFETAEYFPAGGNTVNVLGPSVSTLVLRPAARSTINLLNVPARTEVHIDRLATVNVGNGDLSTLGGTVTLIQGGSEESAVLNINDHGATAGQTHTLGAAGYTRAPAGTVVPNATVNYTTGLAQVNVNAGSGADYVPVESSRVGMAVSVRGNDGNDSLYVGRGRLADVRGPVSLDGGPGNDDVRFDNASGAAFGDTLVTAGALSADGGHTHTYAGAELVSLLLPTFGSRTTVRALAGPFNISGGGGDDLVLAGGGDLDSNFAPGTTLFFDGANGNDRIEYDDRTDTNNPLLDPDHYTLDARLVQLFGDLFLRYDRLTKGPAAAPTVESWRVEQRVLLASDAGTQIRVLDAGSGLRIEANGGDDAVSVHDTPAAQPVVVHTGEGSDSLDVNTDAAAADLLPAVVLLARTDSVSTLHVRPGGTLRVGPGATLTKASAPSGSFFVLGVIDLAGGAMVVKEAPALLTYLREALRGGYNAGAWNGLTSPQPDGTAGGAIHSSLAAATPAQDAVGLAPAAALSRRPFMFAGQLVSPADLLLRHTLTGDANLDTRVDARDLALARSGSGKPSARWDQGDFNFDTRSDARDYLLLRRNHGRVLLLPPAAGV